MGKYRDENQFSYLKGFSGIVTILSAVLVFGGILSVVELLPDGIKGRLVLFLTEMTEIFGVAALLLIFSSMIWMLVKKRHVLFGWIVAAAGTAHSLYFLIFIPSDMEGVYSGLVAF